MDVKDPAVPLNFAVFLHNRKESEEAKKMLQMFEMRVQRLRQTPPGLDADPDVSTRYYVQLLSLNLLEIFSKTRMKPYKRPIPYPPEQKRKNNSSFFQTLVEIDNFSQQFCSCCLHFK